MAENTRCDQCGGVDDHPKMHFFEDRTVHFDCASAAEVELATNAAQEAGSGPKHSAVIRAARDGVHGDDLRQQITGGKLEQAEGLHYEALEASA